MALLGAETATTTSMKGNPEERLGRPQKRSAKDCLSNLPVELILMINKNLEDPADTVALGLTCQHLWRVIRVVLYGEKVQRYGSWIGQKLTCGNAFYRGRQYPPEYFSGVETEATPAPYRGQVRRWVLLWRLRRMRKYMVDRISWRRGYQHADIAPLAGWSEFDNDDTYLAPDLKWRLLNLTTGEFVRAEGLAVAPELVHGPHIKHIGFAEVLMVRTCWATDPRDLAKHRALGVAAHGPWAGHRFAIVTEDRLREPGRGGLAAALPAKDVSGEVAAEMYAIWELRFGSDWRRVITAPDFTPPRVSI